MVKISEILSRFGPMLLSYFPGSCPGGVNSYVVLVRGPPTALLFGKNPKLVLDAIAVAITKAITPFHFGNAGGGACSI